MSLLRLAAYLVLLVLAVGALLNFVRPAREEGGTPRLPARFSLPGFEAGGKSPRVYVDPSEVALRSNVTISGGMIVRGDRLLDETLPISLSMLSSDRVDPGLYYTYYAYTISIGSYGLGSREYEIHALPVSEDDKENLSRVGATVVVPEQIVVPSFRLARLSDRSWEVVGDHVWIPELKARALAGIPRYVLTYAPTYRLNASWAAEPAGSLVVAGWVDVSYGYQVVGHVYELEGCEEVGAVEGNRTVTECTYGVHTVYRFHGGAVFYAGDESERTPLGATFTASPAAGATVWYGEGGYFRGLGPLASAEVIARVGSEFAGCAVVNETYRECYRVYYVSGTEVVKRARTLELVKLSLKLAVAAEPYSGVKPTLEVVDTCLRRAERLPFGNSTVVRVYAAWPWEEGRCHLAFYSEDVVEYPRGLELDLGPFSRKIETLLNVTRRSWLGGVIVEFGRPTLKCEWGGLFPCRVEPVVRVEPALLNPPEIEVEKLSLDPELPRRFLEYLVVRYIHDIVDRLIPLGVPYRDGVRYAMLAQVPLSMAKVCALESSTRLLEALARGCGDGYAKASLLAALVSFSTPHNLTLAPLVELGNRTAWTVFARITAPPLWELERWGYYGPELKVIATSPEVGLFVRLTGVERGLTYARSYRWELPSLALG